MRDPSTAAHLVRVRLARLDIFVLELDWVARPRTLRGRRVDAREIGREEGERDRLRRARPVAPLRDLARRQLLQPRHTLAVDIERPDVVVQLPLRATAKQEEHRAHRGDRVPPSRRWALESDARQRPDLRVEIEDVQIVMRLPLATEPCPRTGVACRLSITTSVGAGFRGFNEGALDRQPHGHRPPTMKRLPPIAVAVCANRGSGGNPDASGDVHEACWPTALRAGAAPLREPLPVLAAPPTLRAPPRCAAEEGGIKTK